MFEQTWQKHGSAPLEALSDTKHAKTCQDTMCQTFMSKQGSNMAVDHPNASGYSQLHRLIGGNLLTFFLIYLLTFFLTHFAVEVRRGTLASQARGWGPARNTEYTGSRLRSGAEHCAHRIAVEVRRGTRHSQDRGWGPARNTALTGSPLRSGAEHCTHRIAVEVRHRTGREEETRRTRRRRTRRRRTRRRTSWHKIEQPSPDRWGITNVPFEKRDSLSKRKNFYLLFQCLQLQNPFAVSFFFRGKKNISGSKKQQTNPTGDQGTIYMWPSHSLRSCLSHPS